MNNLESFLGEAELHKALAPLLSKRDQGRVMGVFRDWVKNHPIADETQKVSVDHLESGLFSALFGGIR